MAGKVIRKKTELRAKKREFEESFPPAVDLIFLLQDWNDAYNVGGLFRVAAACGARELVMVGRTPVPPHPMIGVTSLGMHRRVPFRTFSKWGEAVEALCAEGYVMIAIEIAEGAHNYLEFKFPPKTCLILGSEGAGISSGLLKSCAHAVFIPMYGKGRSLNVHVAAAIVAFQAVLGGTKS